MGKVGKGEESAGGSGTGASFKELTGRKGARKGRGGVGGMEGKGEGVAGACGERSSVVCLKNEVRAGGCRELVGGGCGQEFARVTRTMLGGEQFGWGAVSDGKDVHHNIEYTYHLLILWYRIGNEIATHGVQQVEHKLQRPLLQYFAPQFTRHTRHVTLYTLHSTLYTPHSTLHTLHYTLDFILYT